MAGSRRRAEARILEGDPGGRGVAIELRCERVLPADGPRPDATADLPASAP
jgi:hypothetical protein